MSKKQADNSIQIKSYVLKETAASTCTLHPDGIIVSIQGEEESRFIPIQELVHVKKTRQDPPHFRVRYMEPSWKTVTFKGVTNSVFLNCLDLEGISMLVPRRLTEIEDD